MPKCFSIDFIRQVFEQKLFIEHLNNKDLFGGKDQVNIFSFYEQLKTQDEIDRFVECYRELVEQQNRTRLILNGVIVAPENPSITNIYSSTIIPMTWTCSMRCTLENRDQANETIDNLINKLKGRKVDIALLKCRDKDNHVCYKPFMVGTIGNQQGNFIRLENGDYIGEFYDNSDLNEITGHLLSQGVILNQNATYYLYCTYESKLKVAKVSYDSEYTMWIFQIIEDDGTYTDVVFPPDHESFEKYKVSFSFEASRCDEPRNLNSNEYCEISFSGSATLVNESVQLGNDLLKISVVKLGINAKTPIDFTTNPNNPTYWLEPLEMPSGSNANTNPIQLASNMFKTNSHTDALALTLQYTFICDKSNHLLRQLFYYGRYGTQGLTTNNISPNMIFQINEHWCSWGDYEKVTCKAKLVENIDIENTESDTLTLSLTMQIQGDNN